MFRLAKHQEYAVAMMSYSESLGLFYEAGTGKTMCALAWLYGALERKELAHALVVCPAALVGTWTKAVDKMLEFEGFTEEGVERVRKALNVVSFQKTYKVERREVRHRNGNVSVKTSSSLRPEVDRIWGAIIIDESHSIGAHDSRQTKACLTLAKLAKRRFIMSATPVSGGGGKEDFQKLYGQLKFLNPDIWPNWTAFCNRYVTVFDRWHKPKEYDVRACRDLMLEYGIVARLRDCYDMPSETHTVVPCKLMEPQIYKDFRDKKWFKHGVDIMVAGGQFVKMRQIVSGSLIRDDGTVKELKCSKDDALGAILDGNPSKIVVFCDFRASIDRVEKVCLKHGRKVVVFDGRSQGEETWREFQFGDADVCICQYRSGSEGIDLYAGDTMVLYEPTLTALKLEQCRARIMRKGQTKPCRYLYLQTSDTMEVHLWDTVRSGVDVTKDMMEEWARTGKM